MRPFPIQLLKIPMLVAGSVATLSLAACTGGDASIKSAKVSSDQAAPTELGAPSQNSTLDQIMASRKVKVAVPDDFPPFGSVDPNMQLQGYDVDVAKLLAKELGAELELIPVTGQNRVPYLQTGRVDLVISSLGKNKDRAKIIDFSVPYAPFFSGIFGGPDVKVSSYKDLKNYTVGVTQGSLEDLELAKNAPEGLEIKRFANNSLTASALLSGQVELIATGSAVAAKVMKDNPGKEIDEKFVMKNSPCYIGIRRGDADLRARVNTFISDMRRSGELDKLSQNRFGETLAELPSF